MVLAGKLITEVGIKTPADKFFNFSLKELHHVQNLCDRVHLTKLHEGEDWHAVGKSVKHWTYVIDGEIHTCYETIEAVDEQNKTNKYKLFGGDIDKHYKAFYLTMEVFVKNDGTSAVKWTIEYEKKHEDFVPPNGWMDYLHKLTKDVDDHLHKA